MAIEIDPVCGMEVDTDDHRPQARARRHDVLVLRQGLPARVPRRSRAVPRPGLRTVDVTRPRRRCREGDGRAPDNRPISAVGETGRGVAGPGTPRRGRTPDRRQPGPAGSARDARSARRRRPDRPAHRHRQRHRARRRGRPALVARLTAPSRYRPVDSTPGGEPRGEVDRDDREDRTKTAATFTSGRLFGRW